MQFYSVEFLFIFLPLFILVYLTLPAKCRNGFLALGSLVFYGVGSRDEPWRLWLLIGLTGMTYCVGRFLNRKRGRLLEFSLLVMAGLLVFFKCYRGGALLPPGMSFYLFQMAAYLIDVYRGKITPELRLTSYAAQVMMFPKLMSGPLVPPKELKRQTWGRGYLPQRFHHGLQRVIVGLSLKILLADRLGPLWNQAQIIGSKSISTPYAWLALIAYAMQLYFDFYGYSLMAIGLGEMLGFDLPANFDDPYMSRSVSEFYRRWHITLGAWFRDYLYIPLGGSRKGTARTMLNTAVVWLFTGLWHGIGGSYLLWAGVLCLLIINEKLWLGKVLKKLPIISNAYTVFAILLSWLPFALPNLASLRSYLVRLFGGGTALNPQDYLVVLRNYGGFFLAGLLLATPLPKYLLRKVRKSRIMDWVLLVLFWIVVYYLATAKNSPFLYFQF